MIRPSRTPRTVSRSQWRALWRQLRDAGWATRAQQRPGIGHGFASLGIDQRVNHAVLGVARERGAHAVQSPTLRKDFGGVQSCLMSQPQSPCPSHCPVRGLEEDPQMKAAPQRLQQGTGWIVQDINDPEELIRLGVAIQIEANPFALAVGGDAGKPQRARSSQGGG
jgi:hypothetical protein